MALIQFSQCREMETWVLSTLLPWLWSQAHDSECTSPLCWICPSFISLYPSPLLCHYAKALGLSVLSSAILSKASGVFPSLCSHLSFSVFLVTHSLLNEQLLFSCIFVLFLFWVVLGIEPRALCMLGKHPTEISPAPLQVFSFNPAE